MSIAFYAGLGIACAVCGLLGALIGRALIKPKTPQQDDRPDPRDAQIRDLQATLKVTRADIEAERDKLENSEHGRSASDDQMQALEDKIKELKEKYTVAKQVLRKEIEQKTSAQEELVDMTRERDQLTTRVQEAEMELSVVRDQENADGSRKIAGFDDMLSSGDATGSHTSLLQDLHAEIERWKSHCKVLGDELKTMRAKVSESESFDTVEQPRADIPAPASNGAGDHSADNGQAVAAQPVVVVPMVPEEADKLTAIRGIGAVLERKLHQLGVYRYRELVSLTPDALQQASVVIPDLKGRMKRYDWIEQARSLHQQKYDEPL